MILLSATKAELSVAESETITSGAQRVFVCTFALPTAGRKRQPRCVLPCGGISAGRESKVGTSAGW